MSERSGNTRVFLGLDVGKSWHYATVLDENGEQLFAGKVRNAQAPIQELLTHASGFGDVIMVIDQPGSIASLAIAVAGKTGIEVAYPWASYAQSPSAIRGT